jgi:hypothetical protein
VNKQASEELSVMRANDRRNKQVLNNFTEYWNMFSNSRKGKQFKENGDLPFMMNHGNVNNMKQPFCNQVLPTVLSIIFQVLDQF